MRYLAIAPGGSPRTAVILFAGGNGALRLSPSGGIGSLSLNFLIRMRESFARQGLFVAALDAASDRQGGMDGAVRLSRQHAQDIGRVIADVRSRAGDAAVWLIGTSAGTLSTANAGARLSGADQAMRPHGIVLSSTMTTLDAAGYCGKSVYDAALGEIRVPVLVVSHQDDGCQCSPGDAAAGARLLASLPRASAQEHKIFTGGRAPLSDPCDWQAPHGFFGIEDEVVVFIASWIKAH
jgi:pimeloyl-ACP methyl ester carboxylesterase